VRIVCATNRDPREEVRTGRFREDLFYRLHVVPIHLPRLAERGDDVNLISRHVLADFSTEEGKSFRGLTPEVTRIFRSYGWPGNVRQLLNALRNVVVLQDGPMVEAYMLPPEITRDGSENPPLTAIPRANAPSTQVPYALPGVNEVNPLLNEEEKITALVGRKLADVERELIEATIAHCGGSIPKAAVLLDVAASTIYRKRESWARELEPGKDVALGTLS